MAQPSDTPTAQAPIVDSRKAINKPPAGQTVLVIANANEVLDFKFPLASVRVVVKDIDIYLIFDDGAQIILPGLGIELSLAPGDSRLYFDSELVLSTDFFARVGPVETADEYKAPALQSVTGTGSFVEEIANDYTSNAPASPTHQFNSDTPPQSQIVLAPQVILQTPPPPLPLPTSPSSVRTDTAISINVDVAPEIPDGDIIKTTKFVIYTHPESTRSTDADVTTIVYGFGDPAGAAPADKTILGTGATFGQLTATDNIAGTSNADKVFVDDYPLVDARGYALVSPRLELDVSLANGTKGIVTFALPSGYKLLTTHGITQIDPTTYTVEVTVQSGKIIIDMDLAYKVPTGSTPPDAEGFYDRQSIGIAFSESVAVGAPAGTSFATGVRVGVRDIEDQSDLTGTEAGSTQTIYALPSTPGPNNVAAGTGDDTIYAGAGNDTIDAGGGNDVVSYLYSGAGVSVSLRDGAAAAVGSIGYARNDVLNNAENLEGSDFADSLGGNSGANSLAGGLGDDSLAGGAGADTLGGGEGTNALAGGAGDDTYVIESPTPTDVITEDAGAGIDTVLVTAATSYTLGDNLDILRYEGSSDFNGVGNGLSNTVASGAGNDTLDGGAGADSLSGAAGNDTYIIDNTGDVIAESTATSGGFDTAVITAAGLNDATGPVPVDYTLQAGVEVLRYDGSADATLTGSSLASTVIGGSGSNSLVGVSGFDSLVGGIGADTLRGDGLGSLAGGAGDDVYVISDTTTVILGEGAQTSTDTILTSLSTFTLGQSSNLGIENLTYSGTGAFSGTGSADDNVITGGPGVNSLVGGAGADTLLGNASADTLDGGTGDDSMVGGAGNDIYVVDSLGDVIGEASGTTGGVDTIQIADNTLTGYTLGGANSSGVENLTYLGTASFTGIGDADANVLTGGTGPNSLSAGAGDDSVIGNVGNDTIEGGDGADTLNAGAGDNLVYGGAAAGDTDTSGDLIIAGAGADTLFGGAGADTVLAGDGANSLDGGLGDDSLVGGLGNDTIDAGAGLNTIDAGDGMNLILGGNDADSLSAGVGDDTILGFDGNDTLLSGTGANSLDGGNGDDSLVGGSGNDTISGGAGADTLVSGGAGASVGAESLAGGLGDDIYVIDGVNQASHAVAILDDGGNDTIRTDATAWNLSQDNSNTVENVIFTGGAASGTGNVLANVLAGGGGDDTLQAVANTGGIGGDTLTGGAGNDSLMAAAGSAGDLLTGDAGNDTLIGSTGANTLLGGVGTDLITGGTGSESIDGGVGSDTINAGGGADTISDVSGANSIDGGTGSDLITTGSANDTIFGNDGNDTIDGGGGADSISGGLGNDLITVRATNSVDGGGDNDTFILNTSTASIVGGSGTDEITIAGPLDGATPQAFALTSGTTGVERLTVTSTADFTLAGDSGVNTITGGGGNDSLVGGGGSDSLVGGAGADTLSGAGGALTLAGGLGNDVFLVDTATDAIVESGGTAAGSTDTIITSLQNYSMGNGNLNVEVLQYNGSATVAGGAGFTAQGDNGDQTIVGTAGNDLIDGSNGFGDAARIDYTLTSTAGLGAPTTVTLGGITYTQYDFDPSFTDGGRLALSQSKTAITVGSAGTGSDTMSGIEYVILNGGIVLKVQQGVTQYGDQGPGNPFSATALGPIPTADTFTGSTLSDNFYGGALNDTYTFNNIDDTVGEGLSTGGTGVDGGGIDTVIVDGSRFITGGVSVFDISSANTRNFVTLTGGSTGIENLIITSPGASSLAGNELNNVITVSGDTNPAAGHNDTIRGGTGSDTISAGEGANSVLGGTNGANSITAGAGSDSLTGGSGADSISGGDGNNSIQGLAGDNSISSGTGNDRIIGGVGNDTVDAGGGANFVDAGNGANLVTSGTGADTILGGTGADTINSGDGANSISSGDGANLVTSGIGNDTVLGGIGADTINSGDGANSINSGNGANVITSGTGSDTILGGTGADTINAGNGANSIDTGLGDNVVTSGTGSDTVLGGGNDTINAGDGANSIVGGVNSASFITTGTGTDTLIGGSGADTLVSGSGDDSIDASAGQDSVSAGAGADTILGGAGNDTLDGSTGADSFIGGTGNDVFVVDNPGDAVSEVAVTGGVDSLWVSGGGAFDLTSAGLLNVENIYVRTAASSVTGGTYTLIGDAGDNILAGGTGAQTSFGGLGNDTLIAIGGKDTLDGGAGNDVYVIDANYTAGNLMINEAAGTAVGGIDELRTTRNVFSMDDVLYGPGINNIEIFRYVSVGAPLAGTAVLNSYITPGTGSFTGTGNDTGNSIIGGDGGNSLTGGGGNDWLFGGLAADTLDGAGGDTLLGTGDTLSGGDGNDLYIVNSTFDVITNRIQNPLGEQAGSGAGFIDTIQIANYGLVDNNGAAAASAFTLDGVNNNVENLIYNGALNFTLVGSTSANSVQGGSGNDSVSGDAGADSLAGGAGNDTLLGGTGNDLVAGGTGDDSISGSIATNSAIGTDADTLVGGLGNDALFVDSYTDLVVENAAEGTDTIRTSLAAFALGGAQGGANVENLLYVGDPTVGVSFVGSASGNSIVGGSAADTLDGGLNSDGTADTLVGGFGNDVFVLYNAGDVISDTGGTDTVDLHFSPGVALTLNVNNTLAGGATLNLTGIENFLYNGPGSVTVIGSSVANSITGNAGADSINGGGGADTMQGGGGNDAYFVDAYSPAGASPAGDVVIEAAGTAVGGADTITTNLTNFDLGSGWYDNVEALVLTTGGFATALGNALDNTIIGGTSINNLSGGAGSDSMVGSGAADTLDGGSGADTMRGGGGNDLYIVDSVSDVVLEGGGLNSTSGGTDEIRFYAPTGVSTYSLTDPQRAGVENLTFLGAGGVATTTGFSTAGNYLANVITGSDGADTFSAGQGGTDRLIGGGGNDLLQVVSGSMALTKTNGVTSVGAYLASATGFAAGLGDGTTAITIGLSAGGVTYNPTVQIANVQLDWSSTTVTFQVAGGTAWSWTVGRDGALHTLAVSYTGTGAAPTLVMDGVDFGAPSSSGVSTLTGTAIGSLLVQPSGNATGDIVDNIRVYDTALTAAQLQTVTASPTDASVAAGSLKGLYTFDGTANANTAPAGSNRGSVITLGQNGSFLDTGSASMSGDAGNDTLLGNALGDTLDGGTGSDSMVGGAGSDVYYIDVLTDKVIESAGTANGTDGIIVTGNTLRSFSLATSGLVADNVMEYVNVDTRAGSGLTAADAFSITGNSSLGTGISGGIGADTLVGGTGIDNLYGDGSSLSQTGTSGDLLLGGAGNDNYYIAWYGTADARSDMINDTSGSSDTAYIFGNQGTSNVVNLNTDFNGTIESLQILSTVGNTVTGSAVANAIFGGSGADYLIGGAGNDTIRDSTNNVSTSSADTLDGGAGDDIFYVSVSTTKIIEAAGDGYDAVLVRGGLSFDLGSALNGGQEIEAIGLQATNFASSLSGNAVSNAITAGSGNDYLFGAAGNDTMYGVSGADTLLGGTGNDNLNTQLSDYLASSFTDKIDGGADIDTWSISHAATANGTATINGFQLDTMLDNIEIIDVKQIRVGVNFTNITADNIAGITGQSLGTSNVLTIKADAATAGNNVLDTVSTSLSASGLSSTSSTVVAGGVTTTTTTFYNSTTLQDTAHQVAQLVLQAS